MILKSAQVTNFRSVEDSGEFLIDDITCLVGKNEAGKTAILTALSGLKPHPSSPIEYNVERDYPRRHLNDYKERHPGKDAVVVTTKWSLDDSDIEEIEQLLCEGAVKDREVTALRRYGATAPEWEISIDYRKVVDHFINSASLSAPEKSQIGKPANSQELRAAIEKIDQPSPKQSGILSLIEGLPGKTIRGAIIAICNKNAPFFMYFSHYDRMAGQVRLDNLPMRLAKTEDPTVKTGELVFLDFLHFAGTSLDEINATDTYETLNARCESASIKITDELREYWRQNPNLTVEVRVTKAEPGDDPPFNQGIVARARVRNEVYRMSVPFSERSAGFIWFFSFLVKFAEVKKSGDAVLLVLDEPGLTLHGTAQSDLLRYFRDKLAPFHQLVYSTHSPFMVSPDKFENARIVEDRLYQKQPLVWESEGTKVRDDVLSVDRDTLFPLQGALGYDITQSLFVGKNTLLVEGTSDIVYLQVLSDALRQRNRKFLDPRWTLCPAGGIDKIQPFVSLFGGQELHIAALTDYSKRDKTKLQNLRNRQILEDGHLLTFASLLERDEADVEDLFAPGIYAEILNRTYELTGDDKQTASSLANADENTERLVKQAEAAMRLVSPDVDEFDHFAPAGWLIRNQDILDGSGGEIDETLQNAEKVIEAINAVLPEA